MDIIPKASNESDLPLQVVESGIEGIGCFEQRAEDGRLIGRVWVALQDVEPPTSTA